MTTPGGEFGLWGFTTFEVWGLESLMVAHRHGMRLQTMGAAFKPYRYFLKPQTPVSGPKNMDRPPKARKKIEYQNPATWAMQQWP